MTGEEAEDIAQRVYLKLRDDTFRLPPDAVKYLEPFRGYMPPPVAVGYGPDYCMLVTSIGANGTFTIQLRAPDGTVLFQHVMSP